MSNRYSSASKPRPAPSSATTTPTSSTATRPKPTLNTILAQASNSANNPSSGRSNSRFSTSSASSSSTPTTSKTPTSGRSVSAPKRPAAFGSSPSPTPSNNNNKNHITNSPPTTAATTNTSSATNYGKKSLASSRLNPHKVSNPFSSKGKYKTNFGIVYDSGEIPCRIYHTGNRMLIQWDQHPDELSYNPMILNFAEGLRESQHPYVFIARQGLKELLGSGGAKQKLLSDQFLLNQLSNAIRMALMSPEKDGDVFEAGLSATEDLCMCLEGEIPLSVLDKLLVPVSRKSFDKQYSQKITNVLQSIDQSCGSNDEVLKLIRKKVPSYLR